MHQYDRLSSLLMPIQQGVEEYFGRTLRFASLQPLAYHQHVSRAYCQYKESNLIQNLSENLLLLQDQPDAQKDDELLFLY